MSTKLEGAVEALGREIGADSGLLLRILSPLGEHNVEAYRHSLRVCLLATRLAAYASVVLGDVGVDQHLAFFGSAWHDIGKLDVPNSVLRAKMFGEKERRAIEHHPMTGHSIVALAGHHRIALVVGLHHAFQAHPYGLDPRQCPDQVVVRTARAVAMCDFFDALTTRRDARFETSERSHPAEVLAEHFPGYWDWAGWLASERGGAVA